MTLSPSSTPGARLRARRQELGLTLDEVADRTRIRRTYLEALEDDRRDAFPGEAYRVGFLRIYAGLLGLKPEKLLEDEAPASPSELQAAPPRKAAPPARPSSRRKSGKGIYALAVALLLAAGAVFSASLLQRSPSGEQPLPAPAPTVAAPAPPPTPPPVPEPQPALAPSPLPDQATTPPEEGSAPEAVPAPEPGGTVQEAGAAATAQQPAPLQPPASPADAAPAPAPEGAPAPQASAEPSPAPAPKTNVLRLQALGTNRLELILDNRSPQRYDLKADTQLSWKVRRSALIRVDDPSSVRLWFGDRPLDLGGRSQILVQSEPETRKSP